MDQESFSIWGPAQAFYIHSMLFNTNSAVQSFEIALEIIRGIENGEFNMQYRKDELLDAIQNIVSQAGAISRYFFPASDSPRGANQNQKNMHKNRGQFLREAFGIDENSPLKDRGLRNAIEHFDERLDLYLEVGIFGRIMPSVILFEPEETDIPYHLFRAYFLKTGEFQILGERFYIQPIADELVNIHNKLINYESKGSVLK